MGQQIIKDRDSKDRQLELMLLKRVKEKEAKEEQGERQKMLQLKRNQKELRTFLAVQVQDK